MSRTRRRLLPIRPTTRPRGQRQHRLVDDVATAPRRQLEIKPVDDRVQPARTAGDDTARPVRKQQPLPAATPTPANASR
jgi:hypothetical protein